MMRDLDEIADDNRAFMTEWCARNTQAAEEVARSRRVTAAGRLCSEWLPPWLRPTAEQRRARTWGTALLGRVTEPRLLEGIKTWRPGQNLMLMGKSGIGKTSALALLWRQILGRGITAGGDDWEFARRMVWVRAVRLGRAQVVHRMGRGTPPLIAAAQDASLLFLDDLDMDPTGVAEVAKVIADRYELPAYTVMSTGLDPSELSNTFGGAVTRKILNTGGRHALLVNAFQPERVISGTPEPDGKMAAAGDA